MHPSILGTASSFPLAAARCLQFDDPAKSPQHRVVDPEFKSSSVGCSATGSDQVTNQLIAQLRQLTAADGARFAAKYGSGGISLHQHQQNTSQILNSKCQKPSQSILLSAVPDSQLPSFYRADSRARCCCCKRQAGASARIRCQNVGEEDVDSDKSSSSSSGVALLSGGVGKKRRYLVQTKICDMFPNKKKIKLTCQAAPSKK